MCVSNRRKLHHQQVSCALDDAAYGSRQDTLSAAQRANVGFVGQPLTSTPVAEHSAMAVVPPSVVTLTSGTRTRLVSPSLAQSLAAAFLTLQLSRTPP